jgi:hypothetical protein
VIATGKIMASQRRTTAPVSMMDPTTPMLNLKGEAYLLELKENGQWCPFMLMVDAPERIAIRKAKVRVLLLELRDGCLTTPPAGCVGSRWRRAE